MNYFLKYAVEGKPLLLILDGHSSHYEHELIKYAKENEVILVCLPPHTTLVSNEVEYIPLTQKPSVVASLPKNLQHRILFILQCHKIQVILTTTS